MGSSPDTKLTAAIRLTLEASSGFGTFHDRDYNGTTSMQHRRFNVRQEKPPVNWRRGMFRLWILASSAWLMGWVIYFMIKFMSGEFSGPDLPVVPVVLFGPPLALLLFGIAARWAIRGFETEQTSIPQETQDKTVG